MVSYASNGLPDMLFLTTQIHGYYYYFYFAYEVTEERRRLIKSKVSQLQVAEVGFEPPQSDSRASTLSH